MRIPSPIKVEKFKTWLIASGVEILPTTNVYEVLRFKTEAGVHVVYEGRRGTSFTGDAYDAYCDFVSKKNSWQSLSKGAAERKRLRKALFERDGDKCFYCQKTVVEGSENDQDRATIEHLLSIDAGGNHHLSNLVLSCIRCNAEVGSLPIIKKIEFKRKKEQK